MEKTIGQVAKALATKAGVKTKVKTQNRFIYVTFLSEPTNELVEQIRSLETVEAHGDSQNDTRWYSGQSIQFRFEYIIPQPTVSQFDAIKASFSKTDIHFHRAVRAQMGARGRACLDNLIY